MYARFAESRVRTALSDTPIVMVVGPRRAGKTTLVRGIDPLQRQYLTLDDHATLAAATADPVGFVRGLDRVTLDEVQRAPELVLAIKRAVDEDRRPGRFLLTGSANVLALPRVGDSLAGRVETITMLPLAQAEILGIQPQFLHYLFDGKFLPGSPVSVGDELVLRVLTGGFPESVHRTSEKRSQAWARSYLDSIIRRDIPDIATVDRLAELPKLVRILAEHSGQLVNYSQLGAGIGLSYKTAQRYLSLLEQVFLVRTLQPWYTNALKRIVKTPKVHFLDSGILAAARGLTFDRLKADREALGALLESFVHAEVRKLVTNIDTAFEAFHFRDNSGTEVDLVLERQDGQIAGIEVKAAATVRGADFKGLRVLAEVCGKRFAAGVVLYDGEDLVPFGERLFAVPLSHLWN